VIKLIVEGNDFESHDFTFDFLLVVFHYASNSIACVCVLQVAFWIVHCAYKFV
jgi:hypothetical protein